MLRYLLVLGCLVPLSTHALAHGIGLDATRKGNRIVIEAYFDDDTPAAAAQVKVISPDGSQYLEGKTDADGKWSFPTPPIGKYKVIVDAGSGHVTRTTIEITPEIAAAAQLESADTSEGQRVSEGPSRSWFTQEGKWLKAGLGVLLIALLTFAWMRWRKRANPPSTATSLNG